MRWTADTPTEPGDYLWRIEQAPGRRGACSIYVGGYQGDRLLVDYGGHHDRIATFAMSVTGGLHRTLQWAGPIPEPEDG